MESEYQTCIYLLDTNKTPNKCLCCSTSAQCINKRLFAIISVFLINFISLCYDHQFFLAFYFIFLEKQHVFCQLGICNNHVTQLMTKNQIENALLIQLGTKHHTVDVEWSLVIGALYLYFQLNNNLKNQNHFFAPIVKPGEFQAYPSQL